MKKKQSKIYLFPAAMLGITATAGMIANIPGANADDNPAIDDTINITVDSACTMGQTVLQGNESLNPGGTKVVGSSRIAAYCNDNEGYAIYAIGYTNGEYGNTNLVSTDGNHTIPTGTSGNNSYWNMKLTQGTATGITSYLPTMVNEFTTNTTIPNDYTKVAYRDSSTISQTEDPTVSGSYFTTTYAAHVSTAQSAGIYNGQVQYVMVHPSSAPAPEKPVTINDLTYMQDFATLSAYGKTTVFDSMDTDVQYTLIDNRDNKTYYVSKMKDGKVWMTQNLDLELDSNKTYTPADTDVSTNWQPDRSTIEFTGVFMNGWALSYSGPYSASPGERYIYPSSVNTVNDSQYTSLTACQAEHPDCSAHNHVGNYYNWSAAVASNNTNTTELNTQYNNAPDSICPAGWRLPKGGDSANTAASREWNALLVAEEIMTNPTGDGGFTANGFNKIRTAPLWLVRSGYVIGGTLSEIGNGGYYDSSTVYMSAQAYALYFYSSWITSSGNYGRNNGHSVRCLVK